MSSAVAVRQFGSDATLDDGSSDYIHASEPRDRLRQDLVSSPLIAWLSDGLLNCDLKLIIQLSIAFALLMLTWLTVKLGLHPAMQHELESVYSLLVFCTGVFSVAVLLARLIHPCIKALVRGDISQPVTDCALIMAATVASGFVAATNFEWLQAISVWNSLTCFCLLISLRCFAQNLMIADKLKPLNRLLQKADHAARLVRVDSEGALVLEDYEVQRLRAGQVIRLVAGESSPVDGVVVSGFAECWERVNGAPAVLCAKAPGERLASSSLIVRGTVDIEAENSFEDSTARIFDDRISDQIYNELQSIAGRISILNILSALLFFAACGLAIWWQKQGLGLDLVLNIAAAILALNFFVWCWGFSFLTRALFPYRAFQVGVMTLNARVLDLINSIKVLCFDFTSRVPFSDGEVKELTTLDTRIEPRALWRALFQLISASQETWRNALCVRLGAEISVQLADDRAALLNMKDWRGYRGSGMHATLDGAEFSFGSEEFLIARGVRIDPSEIRHSATDEVVWYLAVFDELVARVVIDSLGAKHHSHTLEQLRALGLGVRVVSEERSQVVDRYAGRVGVELAYVHSEVEPDVYAQHLKDWTPAAVVMTQIPLTHHVSASCQMVVFDSLRWNLSDNHVTLFSRDPALILNLFRLAYSQAAHVTNLRAICLVLGTVLAVLAASASCNAFFILLLSGVLAWSFVGRTRIGKKIRNSTLG